jgi:two-component system sporulation sensor kinase B
MSDYKDLMLNLFFIFFPQVFYPYTFKTRHNPLLYRTFLYLLFAFSLISTMSFPLQTNGFIFDFRSIPLTISFLYAGPKVTLLLVLTVAIHRVIVGDPNHLLYFISLFLSFSLIYLLFRKWKWTRKYEMLFSAVLICLFINLVTFSLFMSFTHNFHLLLKNPSTTLQIYALQSLLIGIYVYLVESLKRYFHLEEEIIKSDKIKIVGDLAASVAHEIRNPLTSVRGFIQLMSDENLNPDKRKFYKDISLEELNQAERIISDYLAIAKPDLEILEKMDIRVELTHVSNVLQTYANYNNIQINVQVANVRVPSLFGDRFKLRQALMNLGKNAIESMPHGGILEFCVSGEAKNKIKLIISDTGIGMTKEQKNRLGTPYYTTKEKGTGLGTMVSFGIIKKMNGKISVESEVGKGTTYQILFPAAELDAVSS